MKKQDILDKINKIIEDERGKSVKITDTFRDAELDSLGSTIVILLLDEEYGFLPNGKIEKFLDTIDLKTLSIRELVNICKSSNINILKEVKSMME